MKTRKEILKEIRNLCDELKHIESVERDKPLEIPTLSTKIINILDSEDNKTQEIIEAALGKKHKAHVKKS